MVAVILGNRLRRVLVSIVLILLTARGAAAASSGFVYALVDVETGPSQIYGFRLDLRTGVLTLLPGFPIAGGGSGGGVYPQHVVYAHGRLYVVNNVSRTLSAFAANPITGALTPLPFSPIALASADCVAVHPSGSPVVVGSVGTLISSFRVTDTSASPAPGSPYSSSVNTSSCSFSRDGRFLYLGGAGGTRIAGFSVDASTGVLTPLPGTTFESGADSPMAIATDARGRLFSGAARSGEVRAYTTLFGVPSGVDDNPFASLLPNSTHGVVHPAGFYIVAGFGYVGVHRIAGSGSSTTLSAVSGSPFVSFGNTGALALTPDGGLLVGANLEGRNLTVFRVDAITGQLTALVIQAPNTLGATGLVNGVAYAPPPVTAGDFDGDGISDFSVFRPSTNTWYVLKSTIGSQSFRWGYGTLTPGDYDGDGRIDPSIWNPLLTTWFPLQSSMNYATASLIWGLSTDVPVPGDYDGDGKTDPAIWRPSTGLWAFLKSSTNYTTSSSVPWGLSTDTPMQADYDGDGKTDPAIWRPSTGLWTFLRSSTNYATSTNVSLGLDTDVPVPGDYDGDGKTDPAVYTPSSGKWRILTSSTSYASGVSVAWAFSTADVPVPSDYDGDGRCDPTIYQPSTGLWATLLSSTNYTNAKYAYWGASGDIPINKRPWP